MPEKETTAKVAGFGWLFWLVIVGILGFFTYGNTLIGAFGAIAIAFITGFAILIGFAPIAGPFLYYFWAFPYLLNFSLNLTKLTTSWLTDVFMWYGLILSIVLTAIPTYFIVMFVRDRF